MNELELIKESVRTFCEEHLVPFVKDWDENQYFSKEFYQKLGSLGVMGAIVPTHYGGAGLGDHECVAIIRELSKIDPSVGLSYASHNSLCTYHILDFETEQQKSKNLPRLDTGDKIVTFYW